MQSMPPGQAPPPQDLVVSYTTLRKLIGWVGLLMPIAVRVGVHLSEGDGALDSISASYYTDMRDVFVSALVLVGAFLCCYRTPSPWDTLVTNLAGIAAVGIGLFPMDPVYEAEGAGVHAAMVAPAGGVAAWRLGYHFGFVCVFFALASYLVLFSFRNFAPNPRPLAKRRRDGTYIVCGLVMVACIVVIGILKARDGAAPIFWPETFAVGAFGVAWLVKGQMILRDKTAER